MGYMAQIHETSHTWHVWFNVDPYICDRGIFCNIDTWGFIVIVLTWKLTHMVLYVYSILKSAGFALCKIVHLYSWINDGYLVALLGIMG